MHSLPSPVGEGKEGRMRGGLMDTAHLRGAVLPILLLDRVDNAVQIVLILADDLDGVAVIQAHHAQDALGIGNAALHVMHADIVITLGGSRHDSLDLGKIGNLDLFHHNK